MGKPIDKEGLNKGSITLFKVLLFPKKIEIKVDVEMKRVAVHIISR
jgi:hypothetical protein